MARPAKFTHDDLLDAARSAVARHGPQATIGDVSAQIGVPVGSIYHRFASREELFVTLWLRSIRRFQAGLFAASSISDPAAALSACAVHITRYCRENPAEALAMTLYRWQNLAQTAPAGLVDDVLTVNDKAKVMVTDLCQRRYGTVTGHLLDLLTTATRQCPYGLVRPYVGGEVPVWLDDVVVAASSAILALGDGPDPAAARPGR